MQKEKTQAPGKYADDVQAAMKKKIKKHGASFKRKKTPRRWRIFLRLADGKEISDEYY